MADLLEKLSTNQEISVYRNLYINPTIDILAKQIVYLMNHGLTGIYHLGTNDMIDLPATSYFVVMPKKKSVFTKELTITKE